MAKKTVVTLEVSALGTADRFSVTVPSSTEPAEAASTAHEAIDYVADKARRALGFLTEDQVLQQREHLEALAASMGGGADQNVQAEPMPDAEPEITHAEFLRAAENLAANLRDAGAEASIRYPLSAALEIVQAELQRTADEPEEQAVGSVEVKFSPTLPAGKVRFALRRAANQHASGTFTVEGVAKTVRTELNRQAAVFEASQIPEAEAVLAEDAPAEDAPAEDDNA